MEVTTTLRATPTTVMNTLLSRARQMAGLEKMISVVDQGRNQRE